METPGDTDTAKQARIASLETAVKAHIHRKRIKPDTALHSKHAGQGARQYIVYIQKIYMFIAKLRAGWVQKVGVEAKAEAKAKEATSRQRANNCPRVVPDNEWVGAAHIALPGERCGIEHAKFSYRSQKHYKNFHTLDPTESFRLLGLRTLQAQRECSPSNRYMHGMRLCSTTYGTHRNPAGAAHAVGKLRQELGLLHCEFWKGGCHPLRLWNITAFMV